MRKCAILAFLLTVGFAAVLLAVAPQNSTAGQAVPVDKEPSHHMVFENEYTRVFSVQLPPHSQTMLHRHDRDYVYVTFGASEIENDVLGKPPAHVKLQDGEAGFVRGGFEHIAKNLADTPFRTVAIEVKRKPEGTRAPKVERGLELGHGAMSDVVLANDQVTIRDIQLSPGAMLHPGARMLPHLLVAVTDLDLRDREADRKPAEIRQSAGKFIWEPSGTPMFTNQGKQNARFVTVEFK